jgi:hypothetical protein
MPRPSHRLPSTQLELFPRRTPRAVEGAPLWTSLPEPTRLALTGLVTRMLIAHAGNGSLAPEGDGDDE